MDELHVTGTKALLRKLRGLQPKELALLSALRPGRITRHGELIDILWGEDADGGPEDAISSLSRYAHILRQKGHPLRTHCWIGYSLASG